MRLLNSLATQVVQFVGRRKYATLFVLLFSLGLAMFPYAHAEAVTAEGVVATLSDASRALTIDIVLVLIATIMDVVAGALSWLVTILIGMVIGVLQYNSFGQSFIVDLGWPIVRDLVNMSVIVILIVIALKTMLGIGGGSQNAQQQLPMLFVGVIAVNFSKTITLILIDMSQVVLFTFVNALDVASGNFIELFQLNSFVSSGLSTLAGTYGTGTATLNAASWLMTSYLKVVIMGVIVMTLIALAIIFIYRIIILWLLVVLSPAAYFGMAMKSILPVGGAVSAWQKKLVGALTIGPIMTFFLWLSLATASQGKLLAETEGFNIPAVDQFGIAVIETFNLANMLSLVIGIGLLLVGMNLAASSAASLGGFAASAIGVLQGASKKFAIGTAKLATVVPAKAAVKFAAPELGMIGKQMGGSIVGLSNKMRQSRLVSLVAPTVASVGSGVSTRMSAPMKATRADAKKNFNDLSDDQQVALMLQSHRVAEDGSTVTPTVLADLEQADALAVMNPADYRKKMKDESQAILGRQLSDDEINVMQEQAYRRFMSRDSDTRAEIRGSEKEDKEALKVGELRNLQHVDASKVQEKLDWAIQNRKFGEVSPEFLVKALTDPNYRAMLEQVQSKEKDKDGNGMNLLEQLEKRAGLNSDQRSAVDRAQTAFDRTRGVYPRDTAREMQVGMDISNALNQQNNLDPQLLTEAIDRGVLNVSNLSSVQVQTHQAQLIGAIEQAIRSGRGRVSLAGHADIGAPAQLVDAVYDRVHQMTESDAESLRNNVQMVNEIVQRLRNDRAATNDQIERARLFSTELKVSGNVNSTFDIDTRGTVNPANPGAKIALENAISKDITVSHDAHIDTSRYSDVAHYIVENVTRNTIKELRAKLNDASVPPQRIKRTLQGIGMAIEARIHGTPTAGIVAAPLSPKERAELLAIQASADTLESSI